MTASTNIPSAADASKEEAEKFVSKVAEFLREGVHQNEDWNENTVSTAKAAPDNGSITFQ